MIKFWVLVILVSAAASYIMTLPLRREVTALKSMCEMLAKAVRGEYDRKEQEGEK